MTANRVGHEGPKAPRLSEGPWSHFHCTAAGSLWASWVSRAQSGLRVAWDSPRKLQTRGPGEGEGGRGRHLLRRLSARCPVWCRKTCWCHACWLSVVFAPRSPTAKAGLCVPSVLCEASS